jgi:cytochrome c
MKIFAGNEMPQLAWALEGNKTFYFDNEPLAYAVQVNDKEDGTIGNGIDEEQVSVTVDFLQQGFDANKIAMGHQTISAYAAGQALMAESDCSTCHQKNEKSIGPTYLQVAEKYKDDDGAIAYLSNKIINGGGGVWGERAMAAHPNISQDDAGKMAEYILSLGKDVNRLPAKGTYVFDQHKPENTDGTYILTASYTDKGSGEVSALTAQEVAVLRHPVVPARTFNSTDKASKFTLDKETSQGLVDQEIEAVIGAAGSYISFENIDLTGIKSMTIQGIYSPEFFGGGTIRVHTGSADGEVVAEVEVPETPGFIRMQSNVKATDGQQDLYLTFESKDGEKPVAMVVNLVFQNKSLVM